MIKVFAAAVILASLASCSASPHAEVPPSKVTQADTQTQTCAEVQLGITAFNAGQYRATMHHFKQAEVYAKILARKWGSPNAAALLQAVDYFAHLPVKVYPDAARTSDDFRRFTVPMLDQCGKDGDTA